MNKEYEWLVNRLIIHEHVEDGPELEKAECQQVLDAICEKTGGNWDLIVNINIETNGIFYDYFLDEKGTKKVFVEEWDNRYL